MNEIKLLIELEVSAMRQTPNLKKQSFCTNQTGPKIMRPKRGCAANFITMLQFKCSSIEVISVAT